LVSIFGEVGEDVGIPSEKADVDDAVQAYIDISE